MAFELIWQAKGVIFLYSGVVTTEDALVSNEIYYGDPRADDTEYQIVDFSRALQISVEADDIDTIAAMDTVHFSTNINHKYHIRKIAFIGEEALIKQIRQLYQSVLTDLGANLQVGFFRNLQHAQKWASERPKSIP